MKCITEIITTRLCRRQGQGNCWETNEPYLMVTNWPSLSYWVRDSNTDVKKNVVYIYEKLIISRDKSSFIQQNEIKLSDNETLQITDKERVQTKQAFSSCSICV